MATQVHRNGPESEPDFAAFVAIDWGNDKHVWVAQDAQSGIRETGCPLGPREPRDLAGIRWPTWLPDRSGKPKAQSG
jgi:hypothetical protein